MEAKLTVKDAFPVNTKFLNRKRQQIEVIQRFLTAKDNIEYLLRCQGKVVRTTHQIVLNKIESNEWIEEN